MKTAVAVEKVDLAGHLALAGAIAVLAALFVLTQVVYPHALLLFLLLGVLPLLAFTLRPMLGICAMALIYPVQSFSLFFKSFWPIAVRPVEIQVWQLLSMVLLVAMVLRCLADRYRAPSATTRNVASRFRWMLLMFGVFLPWSVVVTLIRSSQLAWSLVWWWKLFCSFVTLAFILRFLDSREKLLRVMLCSCGMAVLCSLLAFYSTHHAFSADLPFLTFGTHQAWTRLSLFNASGGFWSPNTGMIFGYGLCAKHELAMVSLGGLIMAVFFIQHTRSAWARVALAGAIVLCATAIHQISAKFTVLASFLIVFLFSLVLPAWRRKLVWIALLFLAVNVVGRTCAMALRPSHMKATESATAEFQMVSASSEFAPSSYAERVNFWKRAIRRIVKAKGLGGGAESLFRDDTFLLFHGHNLVLGTAADYGLIGAALVVGGLFVVGKRAYRRILAAPQYASRLWRLRLALLAVVLGCLLEYMVDCFIWLPHLWFVLGLLVVSLSLPEEKEPVSCN